MTNQNNAARPVLTDDEIRSIWVEHGLDDEAVEDFARAIESALLSKQRAPVANLPDVEPEPRTAEDYSIPVVGAGASAPVADERAVAPGPWVAERPRNRSALIVWRWCQPGSASMRREYLRADGKIASTAGRFRSLNEAHAAIDRAALASAPVAGEAQSPIGYVDPVYVAGRQRGMKWNAKIYDAPTQEATAPLYAAPQASAAVRILFPTHLRKMWSGGEVQAWLDQLQGTPPAKPSAKGSLERYRKWQAERDAAFGAGIKAAADLVKKMVDDYDSDHGSTDPETGTREYPGEGAAWVCEMEELEESIRALSAQPGAQRTGGSDAE